MAHIHKLSYGRDHFTSRFSEDLLIKFYSELIKINDYSILLKEESDAIGFVICGFRTNEAVSNFISANRLQLISVLLRNPTFIIDKVKQKLRGIFGNTPAGDGVKCRLLSIFVHPDHFRKGVGKSLISGLEERLLNDGINEYGLSVKQKNKPAIELYEKLGFVGENIDKFVYYKKRIS